MIATIVVRDILGEIATDAGVFSMSGGTAATRTALATRFVPCRAI
jgi:hypothetical protein